MVYFGTCSMVQDVLYSKVQEGAPKTRDSNKSWILKYVITHQMIGNTLYLMDGNKYNLVLC